MGGEYFLPRINPGWAELEQHSIGSEVAPAEETWPSELPSASTAIVAMPHSVEHKKVIPLIHAGIAGFQFPFTIAEAPKIESAYLIVSAESGLACAVEIKPQATSQDVLAVLNQFQVPSTAILNEAEIFETTPPSHVALVRPPSPLDGSIELVPLSPNNLVQPITIVDREHGTALVHISNFSDRRTIATELTRLFDEDVTVLPLSYSLIPNGNQIFEISLDPNHFATISLSLKPDFAGDASVDEGRGYTDFADTDEEVIEVLKTNFGSEKLVDLEDLMREFGSNPD